MNATTQNESQTATVPSRETERNAVDRLARVSFWRDLREGLVFIRDSSQSLAAMWLAFLVNLTAPR